MIYLHAASAAFLLNKKKTLYLYSRVFTASYSSLLEELDDPEDRPDGGCESAERHHDDGSDVTLEAIDEVLTARDDLQHVPAGIGKGAEGNDQTRNENDETSGHLFPFQARPASS